MKGFPCIICEYDKELDDHKEAVAEAYRQHGYKPGEVTIICVPAGSRSAKMVREARPFSLGAELAGTEGVGRPWQWRKKKR